MFCQNCGSSISDANNFCPSCGFQVKNTKNSTDTTYTTPENRHFDTTNYNQNQIKLPAYLKWPVICFLYVFFAFFPAIPIILTILRLKFNKKNPQFNNNGFKKTILFIVGYLAVVLLVSIILTAVNTKKYDDTLAAIENQEFEAALELLNKNYPDPNDGSGTNLWFEYYCGLNQFDTAADLYFTKIENANDILNCKYYIETIATIQAALSEENQKKFDVYEEDYKKAKIEYEASLTTTEAPTIAEAKTTETTTTEKLITAPITTQPEITTTTKTESTSIQETTTTMQNPANHSSTRTPKFSSPEVLDNYNIQTVGTINNNLCILIDNNGNTQYVDLKKEKVITTISSLYDEESLKYNYLFYTNTIDYWNSILLDAKGNTVFTPIKDVSIKNIYYDKGSYIGKRLTNEIDFSGYEYALISFDGEVLTEWVKDINGSDFVDFGNGIYYFGSEVNTIDGNDYYTYYIIDFFNNALVYEWPKLEHPSYNYTIDYSQYNDPFDNLEFEQSKYNDKNCFLCIKNPTFSELCFYKIDRKGNYEITSFAQQYICLAFIDSLEMYVYATGTEYLEYYTDFKVKDVYGNIILSLPDAYVTKCLFEEDYFIVVQKNKSGAEDTSFYSVYDYSGNEIHQPFIVKGYGFELIKNTDYYALSDSDTLKIYNMKDELVHSFSPITVKEGALIGKKNYIYTISDITVYDNYYVIRGYTDNGKYRSFIGEIY